MINISSVITWVLGFFIGIMCGTNSERRFIKCNFSSQFSRTFLTWRDFLPQHLPRKNAINVFIIAIIAWSRAVVIIARIV